MNIKTKEEYNKEYPSRVVVLGWGFYSVDRVQIETIVNGEYVDAYSKGTQSFAVLLKRAHGKLETKLKRLNAKLVKDQLKELAKSN